MMVVADLLKRGYKVALPIGENWRYDLIVDRGQGLERVQVKYSCSLDGRTFVVRCKTVTTTKGRVNAVHRYTAQDFEWLAVYEQVTGLCYYIPATELGEGRNEMWFRLDQVPEADEPRPKNARYAAEYKWTI